MQWGLGCGDGLVEEKVCGGDLICDGCLKGLSWGRGRDVMVF